MYKSFITLALLVVSSFQFPDDGLDVHEYIQNEIFQTGYSKNTSKIKRSTYCETETGQTGECIPYYLCDGGVAKTDGSGIIDLRVGDDGTSCSYLNVCCLPPNTRYVTDPIRPAINQRQGCGWRNPSGLGFRIAGRRDNEAEFGEFPWMVAVLRLLPIDDYDSVLYYIGGGSLIHPRVVLTAAHILDLDGDMTALYVRAGEWDTQTEGELYPHQDRYVAEVDVHERFNRANLYYDVALLFVERPFDLAPNVGLACIPIFGDPLDLYGECLASGWGKDKFGRDGQYQNIMKRVELQLVDRTTCQARLQTTRLYRYFQLHSSFLCAGGESGKDTCTGDGGSPLVCPIQSQKDRYKQVGIVSWGIQCGQPGMPAAYVDVSKLSGWIDQHVSMRGLDTTLYRY